VAAADQPFSHFTSTEAVVSAESLAWAAPLTTKAHHQHIVPRDGLQIVGAIKAVREMVGEHREHDVERMAQEMDDRRLRKHQRVGPAPLINLAPEIGDFVDTAAIIDALDLVVTVDTSVAHLAGAMAKPAGVLLPFAPDWRWLRERHDSPWYPSLRLFRQNRPGDWSDAVASLAQFIDKH